MTEEARKCRNCQEPSSLARPVHENGLCSMCECGHGEVGWKCPLCYRNRLWRDMGILEPDEDP